MYLWRWSNQISHLLIALHFQLSSAWDFFITCIGLSYVIWNPLIYALFNPKFQQAVKDYVREEVKDCETLLS